MHERQVSTRRVFLLTCAAPLAALAAPCLADAAQKAGGKRPRRQRRKVLARQVGAATFYSRAFHGQRTASGARYDQNALTAAHPTWPFGTVVRVTGLANGRSVTVRITDRGPVGRSRRKGTVIDLSRAAARRLQMIEDGRTRVRLEVLRWGTGATVQSAPQ
jgi:rare lipoprotein A